MGSVERSAQHLLSTLVDPLLRDNVFFLDNFFSGCSFGEFKSFLLDQASIDNEAFGSFYVKLLQDKTYEPLLQAIWSEGTFSEELRDKYYSLQAEIVKHDARRFVSNLITSKSGRECLEEFLTGRGFASLDGVGGNNYWRTEFLQAFSSISGDKKIGEPLKAGNVVTINLLAGDSAIAKSKNGALDWLEDKEDSKESKRDMWIRQLQEADQRLWQGYRSRQALSRAMSYMASFGSTGDLAKIQAASDEIQTLIERVKENKNDDNLKMIISEALRLKMGEGGIIFQGVDAAQNSYEEVLVSTAEFVGLSLLTMPIGGGVLSLGMKLVGWSGKTTTALAAALKAFDLGATISFAEDGLGAFSGQEKSFSLSDVMIRAGSNGVSRMVSIGGAAALGIGAIGGGVAQRIALNLVADIPTEVSATYVQTALENSLISGGIYLPSLMTEARHMAFETVAGGAFAKTRTLHQLVGYKPLPRSPLSQEAIRSLYNVKPIDNPLVDFDGPPKFSQIKPEHVGPALDWLIDDHQARRTVLLEQEHYTWKNFAEPIERMREELVRLWSPVAHLGQVMKSEALGAVCDANVGRISEYYNKMAQDRRVYDAYKQIAASSKFKTLTPTQQKVVTNIIRDFRFAGAELNPTQQTRFNEVQAELAQVSSQFADNLVQATKLTKFVVTDEAELAGIPDLIKASAKALAKKDGKDGVEGWAFMASETSSPDILRYADNRALRERVYKAFITRASNQGPFVGQHDNGPVIEKMLALRKEAANLLGFDNYADLTLQTRMAKSVPEVMGFLRGLADRVRPFAEKERDALYSFAKEEHRVDALEPWDRAYYSEKLRARDFAFSEEALRPYLPEQKVLSGAFEVIRRLHGITFRDVTKDVDTWDPSVLVYEATDSAGVVKGRVYMDLYERPATKIAGGWMEGFIGRRRLSDGSLQIPANHVVCNFKPGVDGKPALFNIDNVRTVVHELGHTLQHMLTTVEEPSVGGSKVAWDAVELPSQIMERWAKQPEVIKIISGHQETGDPIPDALIEKMRRAQNFQKGLDTMSKLDRGIADMLLHSQYDPDGKYTPIGSVQYWVDQSDRSTAVMPTAPFNRWQNGFRHVFQIDFASWPYECYAAGFYSYKWAEAMAVDAFAKFQEEGLFNSNTAKSFRENILEPGGVPDPAESYRAFRGRDVSIDAMLAEAGLIG